MAETTKEVTVKRVDIEADSLRIVKDGNDFSVFEIDGKPVSKMTGFVLSWNADEFPIMRLATRQIVMPSRKPPPPPKPEAPEIEMLREDQDPRRKR